MYGGACYGVDLNSGIVESNTYAGIGQCGGGRKRRKKRRLTKKQKSLSKLKLRSQYSFKKQEIRYRKKRTLNNTSKSVLSSLESKSGLSKKQMRKLSPKLRSFLSRMPEKSRSVINLSAMKSKKKHTFKRKLSKRSR